MIKYELISLDIIKKEVNPPFFLNINLKLRLVLLLELAIIFL